MFPTAMIRALSLAHPQLGTSNVSALRMYFISYICSY